MRLVSNAILKGDMRHLPITLSSGSIGNYMKPFLKLRFVEQFLQFVESNCWPSFVMNAAILIWDPGVDVADFLIIITMPIITIIIAIFIGYTF